MYRRHRCEVPCRPTGGPQKIVVARQDTQATKWPLEPGSPQTGLRLWGGRAQWARPAGHDLQKSVSFIVSLLCCSCHQQGRHEETSLHPPPRCHRHPRVLPAQAAHRAAAPATKPHNPATEPEPDPTGKHNPRPPRATKLRLLPPQPVLVARVLPLPPNRTRVRPAPHLRPPRPLAPEQLRPLRRKLFQRPRPARPRPIQRHLPRPRPPPPRVADPRHLLRPRTRRLLQPRPPGRPLRRHPHRADQPRPPDLHASRRHSQPLRKEQPFLPARQRRPQLRQQLPHRHRSLHDQNPPAHQLHQPALLPRQHRPHPPTSITQRWISLTMELVLVVSNERSALSLRKGTASAMPENYLAERRNLSAEGRSEAQRTKRLNYWVVDQFGVNG